MIGNGLGANLGEHEEILKAPPLPLTTVMRDALGCCSTHPIHEARSLAIHLQELEGQRCLFKCGQVAESRVLFS